MMPLLLLLAAAALPLAAAAGPPPGPCPGCVPVFYAGLNSSKCFRIPTIIKSSRGTLLAFSENRITDCGDNGPHHDLVLRRSSDDGKTWGPMITVVHGKVPCPGCPAAVSNPNPLEVTLTGGAKALLLHYDTMNNPSATHHGIDRQLWSHNDGLTWGEDTALSYPPEPNVGALIGPSVGLQSAKGTLYFSAVDDHFHFVYYSTDLGKSWKASERLNATTAPLKTGDWSSSECSLAFLVDATDGRIMMNCRTGVRAQNHPSAIAASYQTHPRSSSTSHTNNRADRPGIGRRLSGPERRPAAPSACSTTSCSRQSSPIPAARGQSSTRPGCSTSPTPTPSKREAFLNVCAHLKDGLKRIPAERRGPT